MVTPFAAAKAYAATQKGLSLGDSLGGASAAAQPQKGGFADILKSAMTDAVSASKQAEHQMAAQVAGKAPLIDVVTAISAAETSLETVMAVRDQVISAYQDIIKMPI